jgi:high affinity Mn2+ porin
MLIEQLAHRQLKGNNNILKAIIHRRLWTILAFPVQGQDCCAAVPEGPGPRTGVAFGGWRWTKSVWLGALLLLAAMAGPRALGQDNSSADLAPQDTPFSGPTQSQRYTLNFQNTVVGQGHPTFPAQYTGANSMTPGASVRETISVDATGGVRLWSGGDFFGDVLMWQGYGLNNSLGLAGYSSGEAYRVGKTYPDVYLCRAYLRETIGFGGEKEADESGLGGSKDVRSLTFTVGHFSAADIFDSNAYAKDPRSQFLNWVLVNNGAWDYPADALGYTNGAAAEWSSNAWSGRLGIFQVSKVANGIRLDWNLAHAWSSVAELERRYALKGHPGTLRLLTYDTRAHMGSYQETIDNPSLGENIVLTAAYRYKYGFGINGDQEIRKNLGAFLRLGWNDGKNQSYEFTDVDRTATAGIALKGARWRRREDTVGVAVIVNGISAVHRQYLAAGGLGILVGDGALDYRAERIGETYYNWRISKHFHLTADYQFAQDPGYNHVRGPIDLFALRFHTEY